MGSEDGWLFENHGHDQVDRWVAKLSYFYFKRGPGGLADCGEAFQADIRYVDRADLVAKFAGLGVELTPEPGCQIVEGHRIYLSVHDDHFAIIASGSDHERWAVTEDDAHACSSIERRLDDLGWRKWRTFDHLDSALTVRGAGTY